MSGYTLYWSKSSGAFPVAVMLQAAAAPHDLREIALGEMEQQGEAFLKVNPRGQVPALVLPDGQVMTESAAICLYLGDRHPECGLLPGLDDPARAQVQRWLIFAATQLYEDDLRIYYPERYTSESAGVPGVKQSALEAFDRHAGLLQEAIAVGPFFLGARMTILDVYLAMLASWHPKATPGAGRFPVFRALSEAVRADPRVAPLWASFEMEEV
ncbi:MAG: glutathione S-transferase family protein [Rhodospirillales bacterium]